MRLCIKYSVLAPHKYFPLINTKYLPLPWMFPEPYCKWWVSVHFVDLFQTTCGLVLNICSRWDSRWWWRGSHGPHTPCMAEFSVLKWIPCAHQQNSVGRDWGKTQPFYLRKHQALSFIWREQGKVMLGSGKLKECTKYGTGGILAGKSWKLSNIHLSYLAMVLYGIGIDLMFFFFFKNNSRKGGKGDFQYYKGDNL